MEKSKQVERIATKIQESLQLWETVGGDKETKQEYEIKQFPKMYHPTDDSISIPLFVGVKKIVIEIKTVEIMENKKWTREEVEQNKNKLLQELQQEPFNTSGENLDWVTKELNQLIDEEEVRQNNKKEN